MSVRYLIRNTKMLSITSKTSKVVLAAVLGLTLALALFAGVSVQKASAQAMSLSDLVNLFISLGIISPDKAAAAKAAVSSSASAVSFSKDLMVGSSGADVTALQNALGVSPATGYFGSVTKAAVVKYQVSKGISGTGYVGALTRAQLNAGSAVTTTTTTTTTSSVVNNGVEGTLSATQSNAGVRSTVYEGEKMVPVLGVELEAKNSDISVQRVKLDLGNSTAIYNKIYDTIYVTDGSTVLAQADLNSNTVVKDGSNYFITLAGFNSVVARNTKKTLLIKVDVKPSIDTTDLSTDRTITLASTQAIRGVDGAGIDQYAGTSAITRTINVDGTLSDSATLTLSTNQSTPKKANVIASEGSLSNELDKVTLLSFDLAADKDDVTLTDLVVNVTKTGTGGATASSTVYLYDGSTELDSASVSGTTATFNDLEVMVPKSGAVKTLTVKTDIRNANGTVSIISANVASTNLTAENTAGDNLTASYMSGSATGESQYVSNAGMLATLASKSIVTSGAPQNNGVSTNVSTSTLSATFTVNVTAKGQALQFGTTASGTPMFSPSASFKLYRGGVADTTVSSYSTSTDFATPSGVTTSGLTNSWSLAKNSSVTVPVTFAIQGRSALTALTSGLWSVGLEGIQTNATYAATFMAGEADWRTTGVTFP